MYTNAYRLITNWLVLLAWFAMIVVMFIAITSTVNYWGVPTMLVLFLASSYNYDKHGYWFLPRV